MDNWEITGRKKRQGEWQAWTETKRRKSDDWGGGGGIIFTKSKIQGFLLLSCYLTPVNMAFYHTCF